MTRDFVGYGAEPPHARWPGEARVAVNFVINFEEGSELSYPEGDSVSETGLIESASTDAGNRRDLAAESMFEYGARVGWWRLHRIFTRFKVPVTLSCTFKSATDAQRSDLYWWDPSAKVWRVVPSTLLGSTRSALLWHFSKYSAGRAGW